MDPHEPSANEHQLFMLPAHARDTMPHLKGEKKYISEEKKNVSFTDPLPDKFLCH